MADNTLIIQKVDFANKISVIIWMSIHDICCSKANGRFTRHLHIPRYHGCHSSYSWCDQQVIGSRYPKVSWCHMQVCNMPYLTAGQNGKLPQPRLSSQIEGTPSNFVFKLNMLTAETSATLQWKWHDRICSCFVTIDSHYTEQTTG